MTCLHSNTLNSTHYYLISSNFLFSTKTTKKFQSEKKTTENLRDMTDHQQTSSAASHNIDPCFLFDPNEVEAQLENQLGAPASGLTAVVNVSRIMGYQVKPYFVTTRVDSRELDSLAPLPECLMSRSKAGSSHKDLI